MSYAGVPVPSTPGTPQSGRASVWLRQVDWVFIAFVLGLVYVSLPVKAVAVGAYGIYMLLRRRLRFVWPGPLIFYAGMIPLGALSAWAAGLFDQAHYWFGWVYAAVQWAIAAGGFYLLYCTITRQSSAVARRSLKVFFALNALISLAYLIGTAREAGVLMPYWYKDPLVRYGVSTGDQILGVFANNSVHNAAACLLGCLYFTSRAEALWACVCAVVLVICTSNLLLLLLFVALLLVALRMRSKAIRRLALLLIPGSLALYLFLSPQNAEYVVSKVARTFSERSGGSHRGTVRRDNARKRSAMDAMRTGDQRIRGNGKATNRSAALHENELAKMRRVVRDIQRNKNELVAYDALSRNTRLNPEPLARLMRRWYGFPRSYTPDAGQLGMSGKFHSHKQTLQYLSSSPRKAFLGAGPGAFSSKLMLKMTGLGMQGRYPAERAWVSPDALYNHLYILLVVYYQPISEHSMVHQVASAYNHVGGEYGLIGIALAAIFYVGYFWKMHRRSFPGLLLLGVMMLLMGLEYWFEMMTLTVVFEWLMLQLRADREEEAATS
jgi:hypothetical protein